MTIQFRALHDMVDTAACRGAISQVLKAFAMGNGFTHHAFLDLHGSDAGYIGDYPENWARLYLAEHFFGLDPVVAGARRSSGTFFWSAQDWFTTPDRSLRRFARTAMDHGIAHGLTVSARASFDRQLLLSFASATVSFRQPSHQDLSDAVPVLMTLHHRLNRIGWQPRGPGQVRLSSRELLCVTWAAKGKTAAEIGLITQLSTRTVQHYLDAARGKLGAVTVPQLVAISKDFDLI